ncbi:MAG: tetratricopeptide repeat protein [Candidatus Poribacteria bacterium]|nr:tetratricopeptide repeat protein [Candidatus Poribacteria bacterium]MDE0504165.1 tetratricopeptide repeat protein [Candidatus Poribacteria bacterium]
MDNNTDETKKRQEDLEAAQRWLGDAREWIKLAEQFNSERAERQNSNSVDDHKLNVAYACVGMAFQLAYNSLLVALAKWPREKDGAEKSHRRLPKETQIKIERWIGKAGTDSSKLLKNLDNYKKKYETKSATENENHKFNISALAGVFGKLMKLAEKNVIEAKNAIHQNQPTPNLDTVLEKIGEIVRASEGNDYIYRGEPECFDKVSSNLYRHYEGDIEAEHFRIEIAQDNMLEDAKRYADEGTNFEILTQLQHFGGKTNLIDFSTDYLVALFFACDGTHDEDGRILLLKETEELRKKYCVTPPRIPQNRVIAQKSKFVQPPEGFIHPSNEIDVPKGLKKPILDYLRKHHGISTETIYNDLHGFILNQNRHQSAYTEFFKGFTCHDQKQYDKAIEHYTEALRRNPQLSEVYNNRGNIHKIMNRHDRAINDYDKAIELNPVDAQAHYNRGLAYYEKGEYGRAIQDYTKSIELNPQYAAAYNNRGKAYSQKDDHDHALRDFGAAISINPKIPEPYFNRGLALYAKGEYGRAIQDYTIAIELKPNWAEPYYDRGLAYQVVGEVNRAIEDSTKAIELKSEYAEAYNNRGLAHYRKCDYDFAIRDYETAISINPSDAVTHNNRGVVYNEVGAYDCAVIDFDRAIELKSDYAEAHNNRGISYNKLGKHDCAIKDFDRAIELKSDYANAHFNRGLEFLHTQNWEKAESDLAVAKNKGMDVVAVFHRRYVNIADFEQKSGVKLPEDIVTLLQPT